MRIAPHFLAAQDSVAHPATPVAGKGVAAVRGGECVKVSGEDRETGVVVVVDLERLEHRLQPAAPRLELEVLDQRRAVDPDAAGEQVASVRDRACLPEERP